MGSRGVIAEFNHPNLNKPAPKPADIAMITKTGTSTQAFNGA